MQMLTAKARDGNGMLTQHLHVVQKLRTAYKF